MLHRLANAYATRFITDPGEVDTDPILRAYYWYFDLKVKYTMFKQRLSYPQSGWHEGSA
ncbi:MAG: hypothetical protein Tp1123DCM257201_51 [Prokaryotic dsDNA virus sp.]|nr:MAG: hypothetical protein Tp1123DCM257201_51 [Prokaryotic dsDNA virus sp.]|tara:strand:+ start:8720 stop:8896 length:177 start_codon:yes stop_codon:yes gene_type:complete